MKNVVIFSTFCNDEALCKRMLKVTKEKGRIGYIPAGLYDNGNMSIWDMCIFYDMGFRTMVPFPVGMKYEKENLERLLSCDAIAIGGGNTFELLFMLRLRGLLPILKKYCEDGGILMGASAGGIVMCNQIRIAGFADYNYMDLQDLSSIGLVDFEVKPHWDCWEKEIREFQKYVSKNKVELYGLREGQAIWVTDNGMTFYGGKPERIGPIESVLPKEYKPKE